LIGYHLARMKNLSSCSPNMNEFIQNALWNEADYEDR
jgi:hypothetical protein